MSDVWVRMYHPDLPRDEHGNRVYAPAIKEAFDTVWERKGWKSEGDGFQRPEDAGAASIENAMRLDEAAAKATPSSKSDKGSGS